MQEHWKQGSAPLHTRIFVIDVLERLDFTTVQIMVYVIIFEHQAE